MDSILDEGTGFDFLDKIDYAHQHIMICTAHDEFDKPVILKNKNAIELNLFKDIVLIEASCSDGGKLAVVMQDESVKPCSLVLSKIESILDSNIFYRLNRSHIVSLREISKIERGKTMYV